jgi:hypothetical protein
VTGAAAATLTLTECPDAGEREAHDQEVKIVSGGPHLEWALANMHNTVLHSPLDFTGAASRGYYCRTRR